MNSSNVEKIIALLNSSHSQFHVVKNIKNEVSKKGFVELDEKADWDIKRGGNYFVTRNNSSIIAFKIPENCNDFSFSATATHNDSPTFKLKPNPLIKRGDLTLLDVEPYGGMIYSTWLDRPLSIAGRLMVEKDGHIEERLFDCDRPLLSIPNLAIHMNRSINKGYEYNPAEDLLPLFSSSFPIEKTFNDFLLEEMGTEDAKILSHDLFLYNRDEARLFGYQNELLSAPRLDDLSSVYSTLLGFLASRNSNRLSLFLSFDNEEVGSLTRQGANGTFFKDVYNRIVSSFGLSDDKKAKSIANSILLSIDNAHANHPCHRSISDETTNVKLNGGIVIKYNANQSYTSDAPSSAIVKKIAMDNDIPYQEFTNRSDLKGGSTLGNISNSELSVISCDIGLSELAMHSSNETMGAKDLDYMSKFVARYFSSHIEMEGDKIHIRIKK